MIPFHRSLIYLFFLGLLPIVFVSSYFYIKNEELELLDHEIQLTMEHAIKKTNDERNNKLLRKQFDSRLHPIDRYYIDNEIEKINLLRQEIVDLKQSLENGFHLHEAQIKQRLTFLEGGQNKLSFVQSPVKQYKNFQETLETLAHPVELDAEDLTHLLCKIEGVQIGKYTPPATRPDLIISELKLEKKKSTVYETFSLQLKLIKREYIR